MKYSISILLSLFSLSVLFAQDLDKGLIAFWNFDQDDPLTVCDQSGNNFEGFPSNVSYKDGVVGNSVYFNGKNSRIDIDFESNPKFSNLIDLKEGSISLWFKFQSIGGNILPIFYFGESHSTTEKNFVVIEIGHFEKKSDRRLYFTIRNRNLCFDSNENLKENNWYHFVAVVNKDGNTGYLNGIELTKRDYNLKSDKHYSDFFSQIPVKEILTLGYGRYGLHQNFFYYKGFMDEIRIYNRPLSRIEVNALFNIR